VAAKLLDRVREEIRHPEEEIAASNPPKTPAPVEVFFDDTVSPERDSHGMVATKHDRYVWAFDRALKVAEVFDTSSDAHVNTIALVHPSSDDPTPDLADISPSGNRIFVSLRGPNPLSGSPHVAVGSTPGLGVIRSSKEAKAGCSRVWCRIATSTLQAWNEPMYTVFVCD
jgi:hypothetical protein